MSSWGGNDRGPALVGVTWALTVLATVIVALRAISRTAFGRNRLGLDDYITFFGLAWNLAEAIATTFAVEAGIGKHIYDIPPDQLGLATYRVLIVNSIVVWAFSVPKFAIIALLNRILRLQRWVYFSFWAVALLNQGGILATSVLWWERCTPVQANWDPTIPGAHCNSFEALTILGYITSIASAVLDMFFALYPVPFVMRLKLSFRKRLAISLSLGLGAIASAISIYKVTTFPEVVAALPVDPTYAAVPIVLFADVEANILIITASLPTIGPIIRWITGKMPYTNAQSGASKNSSDRGQQRDRGYGSSRKPTHNPSTYKPLQDSVGTDTEPLSYGAEQDTGGSGIAMGRIGRHLPLDSSEGATSKTDVEASQVTRREWAQAQAKGGIHKSVHISVGSETM